VALASSRSLPQTAMPQIIRARKKAAQLAAARLLETSADAACVSAAANNAGSSSSAAAAAPTRLDVSGPAASSNSVVDVDKVIAIAYGVLPHSEKVRALMREVFTSDEILDSDAFLDGGIRDLLVWTLAALEFCETAPHLTRGFSLEQLPSPTAVAVGESRRLQDIVRDLVEVWPNPQFLEHGTNLCRAVEGVSPEVHRATGTYNEINRRLGVILRFPSDESHVSSI